MKTPKTLWIVWSEDALRKMKQGWEVSRYIFLDKKEAQEYAQNYRSAGFKVNVSEYERGK